MRSLSLPQLLLVVLALTLGVALVVAAGTTTAAFGAYNPDWDGTSDFREHVDAHEQNHVTLETATYESVSTNGTAAVVLAPAERYAANDSQRVRSFVESGGTLIVADNFGPHGNSLLSDVGASARFDGDLLRDERHYYRGPNLPVATNVSASPYTIGVEQLTLNRGTAVDPGDADVLVSTSEFAYLDRDGSRDLSDDEEMAAFPVVTVESVGDGAVITIGDPSIFINVMLDQPDNRAFATAVIDGHERMLLDYSHAGDHPPLAAGLLVLRSSTPLQIGVGVVGIGLVWWSTRRRPGLRETVREGTLAVTPDPITTRLPTWVHGPVTGDEDVAVDRDAMLAVLTERYPDWDTERLETMMTAVLITEREGDDDE
ncbi:hypothetical protein JCM17823_11060 [Halorubrum gandharaense]